MSSVRLPPSLLDASNSSLFSSDTYAMCGVVSCMEVRLLHKIGILVSHLLRESDSTTWLKATVSRRPRCQNPRSTTRPSILLGLCNSQHSCKSLVLAEVRPATNRVHASLVVRCEMPHHSDHLTSAAMQNTGLTSANMRRLRPL